MQQLLLTGRRLPFSLAHCLQSGQTFAWRPVCGFWMGTVCRTAYAVRQVGDRLEYIASRKHLTSTQVLEDYFALDENYREIMNHFPKDPFLQKALRFSAGLRILRQDPWECLAGFILSSTKQIVHIQQIWRKVSERWGNPIALGRGWPLLYTFPGPEVLRCCSEHSLRTCGMGFRAPYLIAAAREVDTGDLNLHSLRQMATEEARARLMKLKGVGRKIADCVLLFSLGKREAFPMDTWILRVLRYTYFHGELHIVPRRLLQFATQYFGVYGGYAQQCLFHYARMNPKKGGWYYDKKDPLTSDALRVNNQEDEGFSYRGY